MPKKRPPLLVIISGPSASGKTSIARDLAAELGLALLAKDDVKESLFDTLGNPRDRDESHRLGRASYESIERLALTSLETGVGVVVEGNFYRGPSEAGLGRLVARSRAVQIHCRVTPEDMARRLRERIEGKQRRHPGHLDDDPAVRRLLKDPERLAASRPDVEPLDLGVPLLEIDTTEDRDPAIGKIVRWVKRATKVAE